MGKFIASILLSLVVSAVANATGTEHIYTVAEMNLKKFKSPKELAKTLRRLTIELIEDGEDEAGEGFSCHYRSKITESEVDGSTYRVFLSFEFGGNDELCGDAMDGFKELHKDLRRVPKVKVGPIEVSR